MFKNKSKLTDLVKRVIDEADLEQLLSMGCPADEYDPEIKAIAESLHPGMDVNAVWILICNTFHWYFHDHAQPVCYFPRYRETAEAIVREIPTVDLQTDSGQGPIPSGASSGDEF